MAELASNRSVKYFDEQFARQIRDHDCQLNPFEQLALPHLRGRVLDFGCGMGNLAVAAARRGCSVVARDASPAAIDHLREVAAAESLVIDAAQADLRDYPIGEAFDTVVSIGLLMFFDCPTALRALAELQAHVKPGGTAIVNVLVEGTTYLDMFDAAGHCLFARDALLRRFAGWTILASEFVDYPAPGGQIKSFATLIGRKPVGAAATQAQPGPGSGRRTGCRSAHVLGQDGLRQARPRVPPAGQHAVVHHALQIGDVPIRRDEATRNAAQQESVPGVVDLVQDAVNDFDVAGVQPVVAGQGLASSVAVLADDSQEGRLGHSDAGERIEFLEHAHFARIELRCGGHHHRQDVRHGDRAVVRRGLGAHANLRQSSESSQPVRQATSLLSARKSRSSR